MKKIWNYFTTFEKILWITSVSLITLFFVIFKNTEYLYLFASILGATSLLFLAKASPIGQVLVIIFSTIYGYISLKYQYYGEVITYCFMTLPIAVVSTISWFKNPYSDESLEVKIDELNKREYLIALILMFTTNERVDFSLLDYFSGEYTVYTANAGGANAVNLGFCYMGDKMISFSNCCLYNLPQTAILYNQFLYKNNILTSQTKGGLL